MTTPVNFRHGYKVTIIGRRITLQVANVDQRLTPDECDDLAIQLREAAAIGRRWSVCQSCGRYWSEAPPCCNHPEKGRPWM